MRGLAGLAAALALTLLSTQPAMAQDWGGYASYDGSSRSYSCESALQSAYSRAGTSRDLVQGRFPGTPIYIHVSQCQCEDTGSGYSPYHCVVQWELTGPRRPND